MPYNQIPMTIITADLKGKIEDKPTKIIGCAFGVGLSWKYWLLLRQNIY